jgi:adenosylhomocysteine nucleosidase
VRPVAAITGLAVEASIARRAGLVAASCGAAPAVARDLAEEFARSGARALVSFGVAGALAPALRPGSIVLADSVLVGEDRIPCASDWLAKARTRLPAARIGTILGSDRIVATRAEKRICAISGAVAVDMESGAVARVAADYGLPLLVLRTIVDGAEDEIPPAAAEALRPGQGAVAFLSAIGRHPASVASLIGLAWRMGIAMRALDRATRRLGPDLALD